MTLAEGNSIVNLDYSYERFKEDIEQNHKAMNKADLFAQRYQVELAGKQTTSFASLVLESEYQQFKENMGKSNQAIDKAADYDSMYSKEAKH